MPAVYTLAEPTRFNNLEDDPSGRLHNIDNYLKEDFQTLCTIDEKVYSIWFIEADNDSIKVTVEPRNEASQQTISFFRDSQRIYNRPSSIVAHMFRFNSYYRLMICPFNCTLNSRLYFFNISVQEQTLHDSQNETVDLMDSNTKKILIEIIVLSKKGFDSQTNDWLRRKVHSF